MARTSSAAVLAALIAVAPALASAQTTPAPAETTPAATAETGTAQTGSAETTPATPPVTPAPAPADAAAADASAAPASTATDAAAAATEAADSAAKAADATADAAAEAADAARTATEAAQGAAGAAAPATDAAAAPATDAATTAPAADAAAPGTAPAAATDPAADQVGTYYTKSTHDDWLLRCLRAPDGKDPCELYQLLKGEDGKPVAEVSVIPFTGKAAAIANFVAPLETDLEAGLGLQIDAGKANRYPFMLCAPIGCISRLGMTEAELSTLKKGSKATVTLLPFGADPAKSLVTLNLSLKGFTAGFTELQKVQPTPAAAAEAPAKN